jgi:hypothetical protein
VFPFARILTISCETSASIDIAGFPNNTVNFSNCRIEAFSLKTGQEKYFFYAVCKILLDFKNRKQTYHDTINSVVNI